MQHELCTHADRSWAQKQINPCLCWLTEQAHVLQRRWNRNAQKEKKHTAVSGLFSFGILHPLSLYARMKIIPSKHLRCRITSAAPHVQPDIRSPLQVWSHRWRRLWSWKLAPNSHKQRQLTAGQINVTGQAHRMLRQVVTTSLSHSPTGGVYQAFVPTGSASFNCPSVISDAV